MPRTERKDIRFSSADGRSEVAGYFYRDLSLPPRAVIQVAHGMCEYIDRYALFANFLVQNGFALAGNDHIGHGASAANEEDYGYFSGKDGRKFVLADLLAMNKLIHSEFPGVPVILLGHSMGSFFARQYAVEHGDTVNAVIICGTGGPNPLIGAGIGLSGLLAKLRGGRYRSKLIHSIAFGTYLKGIENPATQYDWVSSDKAIVATYAQDPWCTFRFTVNGFHEMFQVHKEVNTPEWAAHYPKEMPTLLIAGAEDPVGEYGKGVEAVHHWLANAGVKDLQCKLYPGMRHEVLNEQERETVYADVLVFLQQHCNDASIA